MAAELPPGAQHPRLWAAVYDCLDVRTGEHLRVDRSWQGRRAKLTDYPAYLQERWWTGPRGALLGTWDTMAPGGARWLICGGQVETWVRQAVHTGVSEIGRPGQQLALFEQTC